MEENNLVSFKPYYETSTDVYSYLRDKESIKNFLIYFFDEAIAFSKKIEANGSNKPFPIQFDDEHFTYQSDYQFFIYILAKWIAKQTGEKAKGIRVLRDYAITSFNIKDKLKMMNRRILAIFLGERLSLLANRSKDYDVYFGKYPVNGLKVFVRNDVAVEFMLIGLNTTIMRKYVEDLKEKLENNKKYFDSLDTVSVAFGNECRDYWSTEKSTKGVYKKFYFTIADEDFQLNFDDIEERNAKD